MSKYKELSVTLGADSFSFILLEDKKVIDYCRLTKSSNPIQYLSERLPFDKYETILVSYSTSKFTILPILLYEENDKQEILENAVSLSPSERIFVDSLHHIYGKLVYSVPKNVVDFFSNKGETVRYFHSFVPLHNKYIEDFRFDNEFSIFLNFRLNEVECLLFKKNKFLFGNILPINSPSDLSYFLSLFEQKWNIQRAHVTFSGRVQDDEIQYQKVVEKWSKNSRPIVFPHDFQVLDSMNIPHQYFDLYATHFYANHRR